MYEHYDVAQVFHGKNNAEAKTAGFTFTLILSCYTLRLQAWTLVITTIPERSTRTIVATEQRAKAVRFFVARSLPRGDSLLAFLK